MRAFLKEKISIFPLTFFFILSISSKCEIFSSVMSTTFFNIFFKYQKRLKICNKKSNIQSWDASNICLIELSSRNYWRKNIQKVDRKTEVRKWDGIFSIFSLSRALTQMRRKSHFLIFHGWERENEGSGRHEEKIHTNQH